MEFEAIISALSTECRIRGSINSLRIRIVRIDLRGYLRGYGEGSHLEDALLRANKAYAEKDESLVDLYGEGRLYPKLKQGSETSISVMDAHLLDGGSFEAWMNGGAVVCRLRERGARKEKVGRGIDLVAAMQDAYLALAVTVRSTWSRDPVV